MIYLDTNILVYAFCKNVDNETQKHKAQEILKESIISKQLILSEISLYEFAFICKKLEEELEVINDNIDFLSRYTSIFCVSLLPTFFAKPKNEKKLSV